MWNASGIDASIRAISPASAGSAKIDIIAIKARIIANAKMQAHVLPMRSFDDIKSTIGLIIKDAMSATITGSTTAPNTLRNFPSKTKIKTTNAAMTQIERQAIAAPETFFWKPLNICQR